MGSADGRSERHLLIGRYPAMVDAPAVLLVRSAEGWEMPRLESRAERAADVSDIAPAVRDRLGADVTVMQCLLDDPRGPCGLRQQVYELDSHGAALVLPDTGA
jgi:hypothetical protein